MAISYKIYQNKNERSAGFKKYYGRIVGGAIIGTEELSKMIEENVSAKESDVYAVLKELKNAIHTSFRQGNSVRIEGLGVFHISASSTGVSNPEDFTVDNFHKLRILFRPETISRRISLTRTVNGQEVNIKTRVYDKKLVEGVTLVEASNYDSPRTKANSTDTGDGETQNP